MNNISPVPPFARQSASTRVIVLAVVCGLLGVAVGVWLARQPADQAVGGEPAETAPAESARLSPATRQALAGLKGTVELRIHVWLPGTQAAVPLREFADRLDVLLADFERAAAGRLRLVPVLSDNAEAARKAALADGVEVFALGRDTMAVCGLRVLGAAEKVTLARLAPEWEAALEFDLVRAITRAAGAGSGTVGASVPEAEVVADLKKALPDWESLAPAVAEEKLRAAALAEFKAATQTMTAQVAAAQQRLAQAQAAGDPARVEAARGALQKLQAEQAESLSAIARRMEAQLNALRQLQPAAP